MSAEYLEVERVKALAYLRKDPGVVLEGKTGAGLERKEVKPSQTTNLEMREPKPGPRQKLEAYLKTIGQ